MSKRIGVWLVSLLVLGGIAAVIVWQLRKPSAPAITYETAPVERGQLASQITASGTVSALVTVQVGSQVSGRIDKLFADFNSVVKKGDVVAKIDPQTFEADVRKARANVTAAAGNLARTRAEAAHGEKQLTRARELRAAGLMSQSELESAESAAVVAKAQVDATRGSVDQAQAALHQAEINLAYTVIKSPIDGVVISRSVDVGQTVAASLSAPTLFTIAEDLRKMQVDTFIAEADVGKLQAGMTATFSVDAFPGRRFKGKLREVRNAPQTVQNVVTYDAVIDVDNAGLELKPGMTANVTIVFADKPDVLKIPNGALRFRPPPEALGSASAGGRPSAGLPPENVPAASNPVAAGSGSAAASGSAAPGPGPVREPGSGTGGGERGGGGPDWKVVWVLRDGAPHRLRIKAGITDGTSTEVVEGDLQEGTPVIVLATGGSAPAPPSQGPSKKGGSKGLRGMF